MKIAISIGSYYLSSFVELNIRKCRKIFGADAPILVSDGASDRSKEIEGIAGELGAYYIGERINRGHFSGDMQNTINGLVFGKAHEADIVLKINQRFVLLNGYIKVILDQIFGHENIAVALPGRPDKRRITGKQFYSSFPFLVDCIFMRANAFDPAQLKADYEKAWQSNKSRYDSYIEIFWMNMLNGPMAKRYAVLNCLTDHAPNVPPMFLRKIQNNAADYIGEAQDCGMTRFEFPLDEWSEIKKESYYPLPRA